MGIRSHWRGRNKVKYPRSSKCLIFKGFMLRVVWLVLFFQIAIHEIDEDEDVCVRRSFLGNLSEVLVFNFCTYRYMYSCSLFGVFLRRTSFDFKKLYKINISTMIHVISLPIIGCVGYNFLYSITNYIL
mmetsp:Transcript_15884/g.20773  ORF Transcript_15884/g.20773 Transcript_15884/m.20773 type:complete len:129 (-) Transcript_15884:274-660(-)